MRKSSFIAIFFLCATTVFSFLSCGAVGLGEEIDTTAPKITLTYPVVVPGKTTYVPRTFTLRGTCTDNKGVDKVVVEYTITKNGKEITTKQDAIVEGETWRSSITLDEDYDVEITVSAYDLMENTSEDSVTGCNVSCDSEAPDASDLIVQRKTFNSTVEVHFEGKDSLKERSEFESSSKDYFQNEKFIIKVNLDDNYGIKNSKLTLFDDEDNIVFTNLDPDNVENVTSPEWTITAEQLKAVSTKYNSGKHYFYPQIYVCDNSENEKEYLLEDVMCWYPESDNPKILFPLSVNEPGETGKFTVKTTQSIPLDVFDDDGLSEVWYAFLPTIDKDKTNPAKDAYEKNKSSFTKVTADFGRDYNNSSLLDAGNVAGTFYLVVAAKDSKDDNKAEGVWSYSYAEVTVTNSDAPIIIMGVKENTSLELNDNKFTLKGFYIDDKQVADIFIAWCPTGNATEAVTAEGIIKNNLTDLQSLTANPYEDSTTKIKVWKPKITSDEDGDNFKDLFEQAFDVVNDFKDDKDKIINESKLFVIYVRDADGNVTTRTFRVGAYKNPPTVVVGYNTEAASSYIVARTIESFSGNSLYFSISPEGQNGLGIKSVTAKIGTETLTLTGSGVYEGSKTGITSGSRIELTLTIEDVLGNKLNDKRIFVSDSKPSLTSITTDAGKNAILISGETLNLYANFSGIATVSEKSKIKLSNINLNGTSIDSAYATYVSGNNSDTIVYQYKIEDDMQTAPVTYVEIPTTNPISDAGDILVNNGTEFTDFNNMQITIDAVRPKIVADDCNPKGGGVFQSANRQIEVAFSEDIFIESGIVTVRRAGAWGIPPVIEDTEFQQIFAFLNNDEKEILTGSHTGVPELLEGTANPKGPYKKITQGVENEGGYAVPNTSTKYVLAFDYGDEKNLDIFATTGVVKKIRDVLEGYGYHKTEIDVSSCTASGKKLIIPIPEECFTDGVEFEVVMDEGCVRDAAGNTNKEVEAGKYKFWKDGVAKPYVIVDRYTHGANAPAGTDGTTIPATSAAAVTTVPWGKARVRILCQTPKATIKYGTTSVTTGTYGDGTGTVSEIKLTGATITALKATSDKKPQAVTPEWPGDPGKTGKTVNLKTNDIKYSDMEKISAGETYSKIFTVGDSDFTKTAKYYIKAVATAPEVTGVRPALTGTATEYEGAYRTLFVVEKPQTNGGDHNDDIYPDATTPLYVEGSCSEGEPSIAGFPFRDANPDERYHRAMYKDGDKYILISYDIVSQFRMQTFYTNYSRQDDRNCWYGGIIYSYNRVHWK